VQILRHAPVPDFLEAKDRPRPASPGRAAVSNGTIVDATIISAPSSTRNKGEKRDPQLHQTAKGNQWYFGMTAHLGGRGTMGRRIRGIRHPEGHTHV
jgi:hypothetical protein